MAVLTPTATLRSDGSYTRPVTHGYAGTVKVQEYTVELAAASSASVITFGRIPAGARILGTSRLFWDDLATSGSPTLDMGLFAVNSNVTSDDDALNDGLALSAVSTANVGIPLIKDFANFGKKAYEFVSGQTTDPGGELLIKGTVRDAATTATGTITLSLQYVVD